MKNVVKPIISHPVNSTVTCIGQKLNEISVLYSTVLLKLLVKLLYYWTYVNIFVCQIEVKQLIPQIIHTFYYGKSC